MRNTLFITPREQQLVYGKFIFLLSSSLRLQNVFSFSFFFQSHISAKSSDTAVNSSVPLYSEDRLPFCPQSDRLVLQRQRKKLSFKLLCNSKKEDNISYNMTSRCHSLCLYTKGEGGGLCKRDGGQTTAFYSTCVVKLQLWVRPWT